MRRAAPSGRGGLAPACCRPGTSCRTVSATAFESRDALALVRRHAKHLREQFAQAMGARITDIAEMDLDVAHLRVPETV